MDYSTYETNVLLAMLQEARNTRKDLQKTEYNIRKEINSRSGLETPNSYPKQKIEELTANETITIGSMLKQHRSTKDWCEFINQIVVKRIKRGAENDQNNAEL